LRIPENGVHEQKRQGVGRGFFTLVKKRVTDSSPNSEKCGGRKGAGNEKRPALWVTWSGRGGGQTKSKKVLNNGGQKLRKPSDQELTGRAIKVKQQQ